MTPPVRFSRRALIASRALMQILWRAPLIALPFAIFFLIIFNGRRDVFPRVYLMSLIFSFTISLCIWATEFFLVPRFIPERVMERKSLWRTVALFLVVGVLGSYLAASIIHFFVIPGWLGSSRTLAIVGMFGALFTASGIGISLAVKFYRRALDRVRTEEELNLARRIQRSFLISQFPAMPRLQVHALNVSSKQVSGDFYDVVPAGENGVLLAIADVAGKGMPAALLSSMLQASLRTQANSGAPVSAIMKNINSLVYRSTAVHQFATFFLAQVEEDTLRMSFTNAGHNHPVIFRRNGERLSLERGGVVVGIMERADYEEDQVVLEPGDRVVLYTDGISEASDGNGELYGEERLYALVQSLPHALSAQQVVERIQEGVRSFVGVQDPADDMTLMVLRVLD